MAFNIGTIREAIATQLQSVLTTTNVYAREVGEPKLDAIIVRFAPGGAITYFDTMSNAGDVALNLELEVLVGGNASNAQIRLEEYLSCGTGMTYSIHDALEANVTLGGAVHYCHPLTATVTQSNESNARAIVPLTVTVSKA